MDATNRNTILLKILGKISLFHGLSNGSKIALISICKKQCFQEGEVIFSDKSKSENMYLIIIGFVDIILSNNQLVATAKAGELFGEMGLFTGEPRSASAVARTKVECFSIKKTDLDSLLLKNSILGRDLLKNVLNLLAEKIRENNVLIEELTHRLAKFENG